MVEFIGLLKVKIEKGINLAVRDMMSSDPYVVLKLGQQVIIFFFPLSLKFIKSSVFYFMLFICFLESTNHRHEEHVESSLE